MISVIIAGGSGTRLWPLSTPSYPKHLLRVNGQNRSLLQNTYNRVKNFSSQIFVITEATHAHFVKEQLPELADDNFIIEPARRGTASCIVAGLVKIGSKVDSGEPVAFVAADHYIRDEKGFRHSFTIAEKIAKKHRRIVLVGVEPDQPVTGFGYIEKGALFKEEGYVFSVAGFKEKPDFHTAQEYLHSGDYLWNCGYFVASIDTFIEKMKNHSGNLHEKYQTLLAAEDDSDFAKRYLRFENDAIEYALIEKTDDLLVVPASFDWMDLGSFADLHKAAVSDEAGNHLKGKNIELHSVGKSFIQNYENKPVAVVGLDNVVVINSPNGVLVARKDMSQAVGDTAKQIHKKQGKA